MFYILKVWICTCLVASLIAILEVGGLKFPSSNFDEFILLYLFFIGLSLLFSAPTFIILYLVKSFYSGKLNIKFILNIIGVLGTSISFEVLESGFHNSLYGLIWVLAYVISISAFIWLFKFEKPQQNS